MINKRKIAEQIIDVYYSISFRSVKMVESKDNEIIIKYDKKDDSLEAIYSNLKINMYEYGVYLKEIIENYAKSIHLNALWIDLNDLSKDEVYYFKHCYEVYEQLAQYDLIMKSEED